MPTYLRNQLSIQRNVFTTLSGNAEAVYSDTPLAPANANINLLLIVDLPAGKEVEKVIVGGATGQTKKYVDIDIILQDNPTLNQRGVEFFTVPVSANIRNQMDNFMFKVNGNKKKIVAANTSVHPEKSGDEIQKK